MDRVAIISVDGHVKAPRAAYRDYIEQKYLDRFDEWMKSFDGMPDGFVNAAIGEDAQWDPQRRIADLESQGVVAEVLFSNGPPFAEGRVDYAPDPEITRQASMAYNRWLVDFCSAAPGRLCGQAMVPFDDVDQAVADIHWVKEQGLGGILMPPLYPGSRFFFDPALDPIWAACEEVGPAAEPARRHGGAQLPAAGVHGVHGPVGRALVLLGPVAVAAHPRRRLRALPRPEARVRRDRSVVDRAGDGSARHAGVDRRRVDGVRPHARWREAVPPPAERVLGDELLRRHLPVHARPDLARPHGVHARRAAGRVPHPQRQRDVRRRLPASGDGLPVGDGSGEGAGGEPARDRGRRPEGALRERGRRSTTSTWPRCSRTSTASVSSSTTSRRRRRRTEAIGWTSGDHLGRRTREGIARTARGTSSSGTSTRRQWTDAGTGPLWSVADASEAELRCPAAYRGFRGVARALRSASESSRRGPVPERAAVPGSPARGSRRIADAGARPAGTDGVQPLVADFCAATPGRRAGRR